MRNKIYLKYFYSIFYFIHFGRNENLHWRYSKSKLFRIWMQSNKEKLQKHYDNFYISYPGLLILLVNIFSVS